MWENYRINSKYSYRQARANSVDLDQTPQNVASDQGLHCLSQSSAFLETSSGSKIDLLQFKDKYRKDECKYPKI